LRGYGYNVHSILTKSGVDDHPSLIKKIAATFGPQHISRFRNSHDVMISIRGVEAQTCGCLLDDGIQPFCMKPH